ncbi:hypothetical protein Agub_g5489 [Astrephomene gubernaculifera]|uniref:DUF2177 domain-containing protein n=1 Tax=Astrephomene gubernaculifera TaxID=47775 RepID=A0AAD3DP12_9CHLO|nr:hypothetical protein Agub_g5489 [Astrephomene gubernaculifera]
MYHPLVDGMGAASVPLWKSLLFIFLPSLVAFIALDITWIILIAGNLYVTTLGDFLRAPGAGLLPGLLAWLCVVASIYFFALPLSRSSTAALRQGALLGACLYGTYEFTNLAVLGRWTWSLALADTAWGTVVCGLTCCLQLWLQSRLLSR